MRFSAFLALVSISFLSQAQEIPVIRFQQGGIYDFEVKVQSKIAQQAMGQAIDFNVDATGYHRFTVTNAAEDQTTLHHDIQRFLFSFDGMGQKRSFDSKQEKDLNGPFGKYAKDILSKKYDMIVGPQGQTIMAIPAKISLAETDARLAVIHGMLKDVVSMIYPPGKNEPSAFQVFPAEPLKTGLTWSRSVRDSSGTLNEIYRLEAFRDSAGLSLVIVNYAAESVTITRAEMMGNETVTTMNNKSTGRIIVDRGSGLIREKFITTESNGNSQASFGTIPVTAKTELHLRVTPSN